MRMASASTEILPRTDDPRARHFDATRVVVLNDDHNTFEWVATALARFIPGVDFAAGMRLANEIHATGSAVVWAGMREVAELYWQQLGAAGLTMAPLE